MRQAWGVACTSACEGAGLLTIALWCCRWTPKRWLLALQLHTSAFQGCGNASVERQHSAGGG